MEAVDIVGSWAQGAPWFGRKELLRRKGVTEWARENPQNKDRGRGSGRTITGCLLSLWLMRPI